MVAPREHAKSTLINVVVTLYELYTQSFRYQLFIGDTAAQAKANLAAIIKEIEHNEALLEDFGPLKPEDPEKWTDTEIITLTGIKIESMGVGGKIRGKRHLQFRPDRIICDDIENDENVATKEQREKLERWFFSALLSALDTQTGVLRVIGTILHYDSLLSKLIHKLGWTALKYQAVTYQGETPTPLWPDKWSLGLLAARKAEVGSVIFEQEFQNNPVSEEDAIIKRSWIKYHGGFTPEQAKEFKKVIRVDPAAKAKDTSDEFALSVGGIDANNQMYSLDSFHGKLTFRQQALKIYQYAERWQDNLYAVIVETNMAEGLRQEVEDLSREMKLYAPIKGVDTSVDKTKRLTEQSGVIEGGFVKFSPNDGDLVDQLCNFGKTRYDDLADAFIGVIEALRTSTPGFLSYLKQEAEKAKVDPVQSFMATYGRQLTR